MIIAYHDLGAVKKKKGVFMSAGNHLTIRDYFDQLNIGKQKSRKVFSPSSVGEGGSGPKPFHRMLASRQMPDFSNKNVRHTGLTAADYLARPLPARVQYQKPLNSSASETKAEKSAGQPAPVATKAAIEETAHLTQPTTKQSQSLCPSVPAARQKQSAPNERQKIQESIHKAAGKYNLPPGLIRGVIRAESNFQTDAVSPAGAQGLMQLMPATARELGVTKPFDIDQNIDGGSRYLRKMLDSFGGNIKLALAAYNAGPGTVRKYEGNVPYRETIQYVDRVLRFSEQAA